MYCAAACDNFQWIWLGGSDGLVRKIAFYDTMNNRSSLSYSIRQKENITATNISRPAIIASSWGFGNTFASTGTINTLLSPDAFEQYIGHLIPIHSIAVENEARFGIVGLNNGIVNLVTLRTHEGKCHYTFQVSKQPISCLALSSSCFLTGSWDKRIRCWDLGTGNELVNNNDHVHKSQISTVSWQPNSHDIFMSLSIDGGLNVWDIRAPNIPSISFHSPHSWAFSSEWSFDGMHIYCGRRDNHIDIFDIRGKCLVKSKMLPLDSGSISKLKRIPNRHLLFCASYDNIRIFNMEDDQDMGKVVSGHHGGTISDIITNNDGSFMVSCSGSRGWDGKSNQCTIFHYS